MKRTDTQKAAKGSDKAPSRRQSSGFSLLTLSGPLTGIEHPVPADEPLIIGRGRQADIRIDDDLASRQHTRIYMENGQLMAEDLKSKNGTFINGQRIERAALKAGDYLRVGESTFHVIPACTVDQKAQDWWERTQQTLNTMVQPAGPHVGAAAAFSGSLSEVSLVDLLQLLANSAKTGLVTVRSKTDRGDIYLREGHVYWAMINNFPPRNPTKALYRMLRWNDGAFSFTPGVEHLAESEITDSTSSVLLEGMRQTDELAAIETRLPPLSAKLALARPLPEPLRNLSPAELDMLQLVHEQTELLRVLDAYPGDDIEGVGILVSLLDRGLVAVEPAPSIESEVTNS